MSDINSIDYSFLTMDTTNEPAIMHVLNKVRDAYDEVDEFDVGINTVRDNILHMQDDFESLYDSDLFDTKSIHKAVVFHEKMLTALNTLKSLKSLEDKWISDKCVPYAKNNVFEFIENNLNDFADKFDEDTLENMKYALVLAHVELSPVDVCNEMLPEFDKYYTTALSLLDEKYKKSNS